MKNKSFSMLSLFSIAFIASSSIVNLVNARELLQNTCTSPSSSYLQTCNVGFSTCNKCIGQTDCCGLIGNTDYGMCKDSKAKDCPDGSKFICNGGNCPSGIVCNYVNPLCSGKQCWGTISCTGSTCPKDYYNGMFCHQDGNSNNFKVCCALSLPVDCQVSSWSDWGPCNPSTGLKTKTRTITQQSLYGGSECPYLSDATVCDPIDCIVSNWGPSSACDKVTKLTTKTRTIIQVPLYDGSACPNLSQTTPCNPLTSGCGQELIMFDCILNNNNGVGTTSCVTPGGEFTIIVANKKGWKTATVRVNGKAVGYKK